MKTIMTYFICEIYVSSWFEKCLYQFTDYIRQTKKKFLFAILANQLPEESSSEDSLLLYVFAKKAMKEASRSFWRDLRDLNILYYYYNSRKLVN